MTRDVIASALSRMSDEARMAINIRASERGYSDVIEFVMDLSRQLEGDSSYQKMRRDQGKKSQAEQERDFLREYMGE